MSAIKPWTKVTWVSWLIWIPVCKMLDHHELRDPKGRTVRSTATETPTPGAPHSPLASPSRRSPREELVAHLGLPGHPYSLHWTMNPVRGPVTCVLSTFVSAPHGSAGRCLLLLLLETRTHASARTHTHNHLSAAGLIEKIPSPSSWSSHSHKGKQWWREQPNLSIALTLTPTTPVRDNGKTYTPFWQMRKQSYRTKVTWLLTSRGKSHY